MKKFLALILALAFVFSLAACSNNNEEITTTAVTDIFADESAPDTTAASAADESSVAPESTAAADESTTAAAEESTAAADESTTAASAGLNSEDIAAVVAYYNAAREKTGKAGAPAGKSTMKLIDPDGDGNTITGDGAIGAIVRVVSPVAERALSKNSTATDYIPGHNSIKESDVIKASATSKDGVTTIKMTIKEQTDGSDADPAQGPVGRAVGTLGSIDGALSELGAEIIEGRDTVKLTYKNVYIIAQVNEKTGTITGGTWHYEVHIFVGDAKAKLGISANLKNLQAVVDYTVSI